MTRTLRATTIVVFGILLLLPWLIAGGAPLSGKVPRARPVAFSFKNLWSGAWQAVAERRVRQALGVMGALVRTDNQLNLELFGQLSGNYRASVVLGNNDMLIERAYLKSAQRLSAAKPRRLEAKVRELAKVEQKLRAHGLAFLLVITPSKPAIYPEIVPPEWHADAGPDAKNNYEMMLPMLQRHNVTFFDTHQFFSEEKRTSAYPFFAASGTHWNMYASCLASEQIIRRLETQLKRPMTHIACDPVHWVPRPTRADRDIAHLANLWSIERFMKPQPAPANRALRPEHPFKPKVVFVGSSFLWAPFSYFDRHRIYREREMLYYFKTRHSWPAKRKQAIDREKFNWEKIVLSADAVVMEVNEQAIAKVGFGFNEAALAALP